MSRILKLTAVIGAAVLCLGLSAKDAQAQYSCSNATYGSTYSSCSSNNTANQASTVATAAAVLRTASVQSAGLVSDRVSAAISGQSGYNLAANGFAASKGLSAGSSSLNGGVWVAGSWSDVQDDNVDTAFDGDVYTAMAGIDFEVSRQTVLGVAIGYEDVDIDTEYNGTATQDGSLQGDGYTIAPYLGVRLGPDASATLTVGYSDLEYDSVRFDPNTGNRISGSTDADRYFVSASAGGSHYMRGNWRLRGKTTIFYASEDKDGFTETESNGAQIAVGSEDNDLGQILVDAKLGYMFPSIEPYALVGLEYDFVKEDSPVAAGQTESLEEDFGAKLGAGVDLRLGPNVTGGIQLYTVEFRDDYEEYNLTGGLRVHF